MKNLPVIALLLMLGHVASAQIVHFGLKGGVNTQVNKPADIIINAGDSTLNLGVDKFKFGTQFGAYVRLGNKIFIQPELLFNSTKTDYRFKESSFSEVIKTKNTSIWICRFWLVSRWARCALMPDQWVIIS